ncbi:MotA/TolQ/ExbB proton channel family protein [Planktothrix mougeotii]|uniref:MotA/TolQ/ExbB proton channel family protein n=1 Tax=Planktothrix mougeotii LEGE 06226 TaxID=1828728 RepID=A0ABR9UF33_9CYAN|nr:MotA/TolQ/ExbB proton channel family protein [Planktothrix mougeotii]MBE9144436.1 MotA/TolQ/ExbB proton channel family protein [Planktothrix mougeotii LEGE 06226]
MWEWFRNSLNSGDFVSDTFIRVIFGLAVLAFVLEACSIYQYWFKDCRETQDGIDFLNENNKSEIDIGLITHTKIKKWLQRHFLIQNGQLIKDKNDQLKFIILSAPSILSQPIPRGPVYFAPTLLTALGVLGTFAGIYLGLQNINLDNISEADNLLKASTQLMEGMKLAFVTSLFGLGTSSFFMLFLAGGKWFREQRRDDLRNKLREIAILETPVRVLSRLDNQQSNQTELVETLKNVADSLKGISNLSADQIGQATGKCFRIVVQQDIKPLYQDLYQELQQLRTTQESQGQTIETLIKQQGQTVETLIHQMETQLIEPVVKRLDESAALTKEASLAVRELRESLGGISASLSSAISTIQEFQKTTLVELKDFAVNLQEILGQFRTDTEGVMQKVSFEIERAVNTSIEGMEAQRQAFELSAEKAADTFKGIRIDFEEELRKFRNEYQESLNTFFTEQNQLLQETLGQQRDGLAQVVDSLKTVFIEDSQHMSEEIKTSMNTIKETVEKVSKLSNTLGLTSGERLAQLQELARTIGDEANQVSGHYQNMATQFNAALQAGNQQLAGYLQQANEVYSNRIQEFDTATATICQQLNSTSLEFMGVAQYLVSAADDLRNTNERN